MSRKSARKGALAFFETLFVSGVFSDEKADALTKEQRELLVLSFARGCERIPLAESIVRDSGLESWLASCGYLVRRVVNGVSCRCCGEVGTSLDHLYARRVALPAKRTKRGEAPSLPALLKQRICGDDMEAKDAFLRAGRAYFKKVGDILGESPSISVNRSGDAGSGSVSFVLPGRFYASLEQTSCGNLLCRFGRNSYATDGRNQFPSDDILNAPESLARWIQTNGKSSLVAIPQAFPALAPAAPAVATIRPASGQMELFAA